MNSSARGVALVDAIVTCTLIAIIGGIAIPMVQATRERDAGRGAARYLANRLQLARMEALRRNSHVALWFDPDDRGRIEVFVDGDGDGVRQRDIEQAVDQRVGVETHIRELFPEVSLALEAGIPDPYGTGVLAGSDPVRIGSSNLLSFSPLGTATSGTIYLSSRSGLQLCVRVLGVTGRTRVMSYDVTTRAWRQE